MSYLFYIDDKQNLILRPDCYKLSPALAKLNEKEMLFVILAFDYHSIYRQFPEQDRIRRAMFHVFDDDYSELLKERRIIDAIDAYKSLQYDSDIDQVEKFKKKIEQLLQKFEDDDSSSSNKATLVILAEVRKSIRDIENEVVDRVQTEGQIKSGKELSFLEKLMKNQKLYNSVVGKKAATIKK